jgi:hypothetical protein
MRSWTGGLGRAIIPLAVVVTVLLAGCGGGETTSAVPCNDAAFRAQDEELYVTHVTVSNALGGGSGDQAALLRDLRRARAALGGYLEAHPPCDEALVAIAATEAEAVASLDQAIAALDQGADGRKELTSALKALTTAQRDLSGSP